MQAESILRNTRPSIQIVTEQILKQLESRRSAVAQTVARRTTMQSGQRQGISRHQRVSTGITRLRLALLVDVQSGHQTRRTRSQRREILNRHVLEYRRRKDVRDNDGHEHKSKPFLLRYYRVFNVEQTEGIADKLGLGNATPRVPSIEQCEAIVKGDAESACIPARRTRMVQAID